MKFGGTSVATAQRLRAVSDIVLAGYNEDGGIAVVVSAFSGMTDLLLRMVDLAVNKQDHKSVFLQFTHKAHEVAKELLDQASYSEIADHLDENHQKLADLLSGIFLIQEASPKSKDLVVSFGERNCAFILANYMKSIGLPAEYIDATECIKTNNSHGAAIVDFQLTNELITKRIRRKGVIYVITGFIGSDKEKGVTTTLGRGGSDYSAAIFAAAIPASALEIWTDVDGVLTCDPRKVKKAYPIPELSYQEAAELSHFGAKVLYAPTIRPVKEKNIPIWIKNTMNPTAIGTLIHESVTTPKNIVSGLSSINDVALVSLEGSGMQGVPGIAYRFFKSLAQGKINVIMITQASSEHSISVAIKANSRHKAITLIEEEFKYELERKLIDPVRLQEELCLLAIIGDNMKNAPGVAGRLFSALGKHGINIEAIAQGSSELNITLAINKEEEKKALNCIHDTFFLSEYKTLHLYIVGVGLVGSTLLDQIKNNFEEIISESKVELVVNGLSNSRKMVFSEEGIALGNYMATLNESKVAADIERFIGKMIADDHAYTVFVDNTASKLVPEHYELILNNNIGISTPNKIALSSGLERYKTLKSLSGIRNIPLHFETNVGAGLPVISTLKSLISSGDEIQSIEAVLSGTLSYIFNTYSSELNFSAVVKTAQNKGLTEPDPREDLSGSDVRRKLLILAREAGSEIEEEDIEIEGLLSNSCLEAASVEAFYSALESDDKRYQTKISEAESAGKRLRYIASYRSGVAKIGLQAVDAQNPFFGLSGSDNMIVLYTMRYNETPLVIRGPGAGAAVTAAGLLAEIINMSTIL